MPVYVQSMDLDQEKVEEFTIYIMWDRLNLEMLFKPIIIMLNE